MALLGLHCCLLSLVVASWGYSILVAHGLLIVVASLVVVGACRLVVVVHGLICPMVVESSWTRD